MADRSSNDNIETLEFDGKGDALGGFSAVMVSFDVDIDFTSDGAGDFMRDLAEHEVTITDINHVYFGESCVDELKTWFLKKDDGKYISFYDEIHERIDHIVSQNLERYMYD